MYFLTPAATLPRSNVRRLRPAGALIGKRVINADGQSLGAIHDIVLDLEAGRAAYAVLSFPDALGLKNKLCVFPWHALKWDNECDGFVLEISRKRLQQAPAFDEHHWPDSTATKWRQTLNHEAHPYRESPDN